MPIDLARARALQARERLATGDTCTIRRNTGSADAEGGEASGWADLATGVPVRAIDPGMPPFEVTIGGRVVSAVQMIFNLDPDQDVAAKDRIIFRGVTYPVIAPGDVSNQHSLIVRAVRVL